MRLAQSDITAAKSSSAMASSNTIMLCAQPVPLREVSKALSLFGTHAVQLELKSKIDSQNGQPAAKNESGTDSRVRQTQQSELGGRADGEPDLALVHDLQLRLKKSAKDQRYRIVVVNRVH